MNKKYIVVLAVVAFGVYLWYKYKTSKSDTSSTSTGSSSNTIAATGTGASTSSTSTRTFDDSLTDAMTKALTYKTFKEATGVSDTALIVSGLKDIYLGDVLAFMKMYLTNESLYINFKESIEAVADANDCSNVYALYLMRIEGLKTGAKGLEVVMPTVKKTLQEVTQNDVHRDIKDFADIDYKDYE